jgi:drug/metabolite transporter (DMT)-like permease
MIAGRRAMRLVLPRNRPRCNATPVRRSGPKLWSGSLLAVHILFGLVSAVSAGASDFLGGFASRQAKAIFINAGSHFVGLFAVLITALVFGGDPSSADVAWGLAAGLGSSLGLLSLYQGIAHSSVAIVSPIAGVGAAALPVLYDVAGGESLSAGAGIGIVLGLVAIALVSLQGGEATGSPKAGVLFGLGGAFGLGFLLIGLGQATDDAGVWPVMYSRASGFVVLLVIISATRTRIEMPAAAIPLTIGVGILSASANSFFTAGAQIGSLATVAVLSAMFPAFTVLLARVVFREQLRTIQLVGLALALVAVGLIASA